MAGGRRTKATWELVVRLSESSATAAAHRRLARGRDLVFFRPSLRSGLRVGGGREREESEW